MNITFENVDKVNGLLTITLEKADYEEKVTAAMKDFRKKANMPGFRPGQVPMGLIKKRFGTEITAEEVNKILGTEIYKYIREQKLNVMGEPLPDEEKQPKVDFETMETFTPVRASMRLMYFWTLPGRAANALQPVMSSLKPGSSS